MAENEMSESFDIIKGSESMFGAGDDIVEGESRDEAKAPIQETQPEPEFASMINREIDNSMRTADEDLLLNIGRREHQPTFIDDGDSDFEDETISERLWGLTEMFPERLRNFTSKSVDLGIKTASFAYVNGRKLIWGITTSAIILVMPVLFEHERAMMEQEKIQQEQQILLGGGSFPKKS